MPYIIRSSLGRDSRPFEPIPQFVYHKSERGRGKGLPPSDRAPTPEEKMYMDRMRRGLPPIRKTEANSRIEKIVLLRLAGNTWKQVGATIGLAPSWACHLYHRWKRGEGC